MPHNARNPVQCCSWIFVVNQNNSFSEQLQGYCFSRYCAALQKSHFSSLRLCINGLLWINVCSCAQSVTDCVMEKRLVFQWPKNYTQFRFWKIFLRDQCKSINELLGNTCFDEYHAKLLALCQVDDCMFILHFQVLLFLWASTSRSKAWTVFQKQIW